MGPAELDFVGHPVVLVMSNLVKQCIVDFFRGSSLMVFSHLCWFWFGYPWYVVTSKVFKKVCTFSGVGSAFPLVTT